jgi:hypothetical protein
LSGTEGHIPGAATHSARAWQLAGVNAAATLYMLFAFAWGGADTTTAEGCVAQLLDFHVFWNAGGLALEGTPMAAFDYDTLLARYNTCEYAWMPWLHPAPVMALMVPFAALPFVPALLAFDLLALAALGLALRYFTSGLTPAWLAFALAPAYLPALLAGQFTILWIAGLLAALAALRRERWVLAGVLIGLLTIKPPLGVLIPVALLAIGAWRTIFAASATTVLLHGITTLAFGGSAYLGQLLTNYSMLTERAVASLGEVSAMTSLAAVFTRLGIPETGAVQLNLAVAAAVAVVMFFVWRRLGVKSDAAVALLTASIPLATPYLWHYDSAFLAITAFFLARHLNFAPGPAMTALLVLFWFGAGLSLWVVATTLTEALTPILTVPPLLLLAFAASLTHCLNDQK